MASKTSTFALFVIFNFPLFTFASAWGSWPPTPSKPTPAPSPSSGKCPIDSLKLGVCADVLGGLLNITMDSPPKEPCCSLLSGLVDLEVAVCLCTAIKANILGINLNIPADLCLLVNHCGKRVPPGFRCA